MNRWIGEQEKGPGGVSVRGWRGVLAAAAAVALSGAAVAAPRLGDVAPGERAPGAPPISEVVTWLDAGQPWRVVRADASATASGRTRGWLYAAGAESPVAVQITRQAIVRLREGVEPEAIWARHGLRPVRPLMPSLSMWIVEGRPHEDGLAVAGRLASVVLRGDGGVHSVTPDLGVPHQFHDGDEPQISIPPNDPRYGGQWYLDRIDMESAWAESVGNPDITVVVVDTGCDLEHPDLVDKLEPGYDAVRDDDDPSPASGAPGEEHGTACAGIIGATTDNDEGIAGVCPNCRLSCVRLLGEEGEMTTFGADLNAFAFAEEIGAEVISNSWGYANGVPAPQPLAEAIGALIEEGRGGLGVAVVFAVGNDDSEISRGELSSLPGVIGVGATNNFDELANFSNFGQAVDLVAPTGALTTDISGPGGANETDYTSLFGGTSSACPVVAGVAGLMISAAPEVTAAEIETILMETAQQSIFATPDQWGHDVGYGFGLVQPAAAIRVARGLPPEPEMPDAGLPDAEVPDAEVQGSPDAEIEESPDMGEVTMDGGVGGDVGGGTEGEADDGCAASASTSAGWTAWMLALLGLGFRRRRR